MAFTTQIFTFLFFPLSVFLIALCESLRKLGAFGKFLNKIRATDLLIIALSLCFYAWACFDDLFLFILYILFVYLLGLLTEKAKNIKKPILKGKLPLLVLLSGALILVLLLTYFKYLGLLSSVLNWALNLSWQPKTVRAILGISFITFSAISYISDIYKGKAEGKNFIDCIFYLSFFPKVVSGPIVLWRDFKSEIAKRKITADLFLKGAGRLMVGFGKKIILADTFGALIAKTAGGYIDIPTAWGSALLYMLQIYYDFSGYSDIAIGLGNMVGFNFKENFNFPYLSSSITEFWRRWHISLGTWFREYIYFPLGGSRKGKWRTVLNIAVVFLLTGIWHGAGISYILWGMLNGVCNIIEKLIGESKFYKGIPKWVKWLFTTVITYFSWGIFRFESFKDALRQFGIMFGFVTYDIIPYSFTYYFDTKIIVLAIIGIIGATLLGLPKIREAGERLTKTKAGFVLQYALYLVLFILAIIFMVNSTYSPFIYFQY